MVSGFRSLCVRTCTGFHSFLFMVRNNNCILSLLSPDTRFCTQGCNVNQSSWWPEEFSLFCCVVIIPSDFCAAPTPSCPGSLLSWAAGEAQQLALENSSKWCGRKMIKAPPKFYLSTWWGDRGVWRTSWCSFSIVICSFLMESLLLQISVIIVWCLVCLCPLWLPQSFQQPAGAPFCLLLFCYEEI